ncbi:MAG TPA: PqqD family protein [Desulfobacterales bacterium]
MQIDLDAVYTLNENVLLAEFDTAGILFDLRTRRCLEINQTALEAIGCLNGRDALGQIIARLAAEYRQPESNLQHDFKNFMVRLLERNLIDERKSANCQSPR